MDLWSIPRSIQELFYHAFLGSHRISAVKVLYLREIHVWAHSMELWEKTSQCTNSAMPPVPPCPQMEFHHKLSPDSTTHSTFSKMSIPVTYSYSYYHITSKTLTTNGTESMHNRAVLSADITLQSCIDNGADHWFKWTEEFGQQFPLTPTHHASLSTKQSGWAMRCHRSYETAIG